MELALVVTNLVTVLVIVAALPYGRAWLPHPATVLASGMATAQLMVEGWRCYPVLIFLEGATGFRQMNTFQAEELVSQGYVVVALDQPYTAAAVLFPDGRRRALGLSVEAIRALVRPSYIPTGRLPILAGHAVRDGSIIPYLAQDVGFALDRLASLNRRDPRGLLTGRLDLERAGVFGVSLGGIVGGEACLRDPRLRACLVMDAPMSTDVVQSGLHQPTMWITRSAEDMRLERRRTGGWSEEEIYAHQTSMRTVYEGLTGEGYFVRVPGVFHSNFTDVPGWSPLFRLLGAAGPMDPRRAFDIINAYSLAFFDHHLKGQPATRFDGPRTDGRRFASNRASKSVLGGEGVAPCRRECAWEFWACGAIPAYCRPAGPGRRTERPWRAARTSSTTSTTAHIMTTVVDTAAATPFAPAVAEDRL